MQPSFLLIMFTAVPGRLLRLTVGATALAGAICLPGRLPAEDVSGATSSAASNNASNNASSDASSDASAPTDTAADEGITALVSLLSQIDDSAFQNDLLQGIEQGLKGRRRVPMPNGWQQLYQNKLSQSTDQEVRRRATRLALVFGDPAATQQLTQVLMDEQSAIQDRRAALVALHQARASGLLDVLLQLLPNAPLRADVIRALGTYDDPRVADALLQFYQQLSSEERRMALDALTSRVDSARKLLAAVGNAQIAGSDLSAETIRKLRLLDDASLNEQIAEHWGVTRSTPEDIAKQIAQWRTELAAPPEAPDNPFHGRALFARTCQQCHVLFGIGGRVGPDITGSHRANLDYLLTNVVDPNAMIGKDYQAWNIFTVDGQVRVGLIVAENESSVTLQTDTESITIPKEEIEDREQSSVSMMPVGLFDRLTPEQRRDLVSYLGSQVQHPMLVSAENHADVVRDITLERCQIEGSGWSTSPKGKRLRAALDASDDASRLLTDAYLLYGTMRLALESQIESGAFRVTLHPTPHAVDADSVGLVLTIDDQRQVAIGRQVDGTATSAPDVLGAAPLPASQHGLVELALAVTPQTVQVRAGGELLLETPTPAGFRGGRLNFEVAQGYSGVVEFQVDEITAPSESELSALWRQLRASRP